MLAVESTYSPLTMVTTTRVTDVRSPRTGMAMYTLSVVPGAPAGAEPALEATQMPAEAEAALLAVITADAGFVYFSNDGWECYDGRKRYEGSDEDGDSDEGASEGWEYDDDDDDDDDDGTADGDDDSHKDSSEGWECYRYYDDYNDDDDSDAGGNDDEGVEPGSDNDSDVGRDS